MLVLDANVALASSADEGAELAWGTLIRLESAPIRARAPRALGRTAWTMAEEFGWAKTYDSEYLALARLLSCPFVTLDGRLLRRTQHLGFVFSPQAWKSNR